MREIKLCVKILRPASGRSRAARVEPCHWSEGYVGVSLQESRATMQVMLGMSLRARWDTTLVINNKSIHMVKMLFFNLVYLITFIV